jgi:type I restriction enzyme S subunit
MKGHQKVKDTEIGGIPKDWKFMAIGDVADTSSGGTPSRDKKEYFGGNIPWVKSGELKDNVIFGTEEKITEEGLKNSSAKKFAKGTLLIALYGATVGKTAILGIEATTNQAVCAIVPKNNSINPKFLQYYLIFRRKLLISVSSGGAQPNISQEIVQAFKLPLPPLPEQKKIAEILMTADEAMEKVDEAIAKTERLKRGLMHELLTKGIGHKEFKKTEIGRIPKEWEVVRLDKVVDINRETIDPTKSFANKKFVYVDIDSVENGSGIIRSTKDILGKNAPSRARRVIHYNDVIMSTVRPYLKAFAIVPKEFDNQICSTGFAVLTCNEKLASLYLLYTIFSKTIIDQCNKMMVGGQYPALSSSQVEKIKIPLPPLTEQKKISEILSAVDKKLELLREKKEKFERIKRGLMSDLLTGKNRVKYQ